MKIEPNSPAFPSHVKTSDNGIDVVCWQKGIPIRLHLAAMAMQGMLANSSPEMSNAPISQINATALMHADDLIEQYNRTEESAHE